MADGEPLDWKLKLVAWANLAVGGIGLAIGLFFVLGSLQPPYSETILPWAGPLFLGMAFFWFVPAVLTGWGLLARKWWGPGMLVVGSLVMLLLIPVGTIIGVFGLYAVFSNPTKVLEAAERDMRNVDMEANLRVAKRAGVIVFAALATLGAIVGLGYIFRDQLEALEPKQQLDTIPNGGRPPAVFPPS
jgi:hypothetical protein